MGYHYIYYKWDNNDSNGKSGDYRMSFMMSETISEMSGTLIIKIQESPRLLGRKCEFKSKKFLWGNHHYKTEEESTHINETPTNVS